MKRTFILLAALMLFVACQKEESFQPSEKQEPLRSKYLSYAEAVDIAAEAASMLENPNQSRSSLGRRVKLDGVTCRVKNPTRSGGSADSLYYVVNYEDEAGFALIAAHRDAPVQLLAVTEAGSYSAGETTENEGFNMYVKAMENSIENTRSGHILKDSISIKNSWYEYEQEYGPWYGVSPMINVRWGQGITFWETTYDATYPYNKYCFDENGYIAPAGCAVVAMAQIMSKHKRPSSYTLNFANQGQTKTLNWDDMVTWVGGPWYQWNTTNADEIALWFRQIGKQASADYDRDGTGVNTNKVHDCLSSFGYTSSAPTNYDYSKICNNLNAGRPVYIRGTSEYVDTDGSINTAGHGWVIDGHQHRTCTYRTYEVFPLPSLIGGETLVRRELIYELSEECAYLHYNWGYDGEHNGFFYEGDFDIDNVREEAGGYDYDDLSHDQTFTFSMAVEIITEIRPNN